MVLRTVSIWFILLFTGLQAQVDIPALVQQYRQSSLDDKIALFFVFQGDLDRINPDSCLYFTNDIFQEAVKLNSEEHLAFSDFFYGLYLKTAGLNEEAKEKFDASMKYFSSVENDSMVASIYNNFGIIHFLNGEITDAEEAFINSSLHGKASGIPKFQYFSLSNLFRCYLAQERYEDAEEIILTYIDFYKKENNVKNLANGYGLLGQLNLALDDYDLAIANYERSLEYNLGNGTPLMVANGYTNLAIAYYFQENFIRARQYFYLALNYRELVGIDFYIIEAYHNLGDFFQGTSEYDSAFVYYNKALNLAETANDLKAQYDVFVELSDMYEALGQFEQQSKTLKKMLELRKKMFQASSQKSLTAARIQFMQEKELLKINALVREDEMHEKVASIQQVWQYWIGLVVVIFISFAIYFIRKNSKVKT